MKYRNKPRIIEAVQWFPGVEHPGVYVKELWSEIGGRGYGRQRFRQPDIYYVVTAQGVEVPIGPGEWVVNEADGAHHYPIAADLFRSLYEAVP